MNSVYCLLHSLSLGEGVHQGYLPQDFSYDLTLGVLYPFGMSDVLITIFIRDRLDQPIQGSCRNTEQQK
jgi:hypothetical protein